MAHIQRFLADAGWAAATITPLAGDASRRRYFRISDGGRIAVLMDAPPETGEDTAPFVRVAKHLTDAGFSAPAILFQDRDAGLLLLEDLGDALFSRQITNAPEDEDRLYFAAVDFLVELHLAEPAAWLVPMTARFMAEQALETLEWFRDPQFSGDGVFGEDDRRLLEGAFADAASDTPVMVLRDFHAENLVWLPERSGVGRVGLLDFQDALAGHPAYDLLSLLEDARRDVADDLRHRCIDRYLAASGQDAAAFRQAMAAVGAQRHLRILGIFARLARTQGKSVYLTMVPRVWAHLQRALSAPNLADLRTWVGVHLPHPDSAYLKRLERP